jgi:predicted secreted Zn-dependent protease
LASFHLPFFFLPKRLLVSLVFIVGLLTTCTATIAPTPGVALTVEVVYYDVAGASADELRAQLDLHGPTGQQDAYTDWWVQWRYDRVQAANGCELRSLAVTLDVTFTFPRWSPPDDAAPGLRERWEDYLAALRVHEEGHKEIALRAANEIAAALSSLPASPSCAELEQAADGTGERILERYRQQELSYDRQTDHGATQGARFP